MTIQENTEKIQQKILNQMVNAKSALATLRPSTTEMPKRHFPENKEMRIQLFKQFIDQKREKNPDAQPLDLRDFRIGLQIGQGAFAIVRRAIHKESQAVIALKTYEKKNLIK